MTIALHRIRTSLALACAMLAGCASRSVTHDRLLVLQKSGASLCILDPATGAELGNVAVGDGPHEVAVSPDGRTAVVSNYGGQKPGNSLTVVDVPNQKALATIELTHTSNGPDGSRTRALLRPHGIRFLPDGRSVAVTSESSRRLVVVDIDRGCVASTLPTPQPLMHMVELSQNGTVAFGTSIQDGTLAAIPLDGAAPTAIPSGDGAEGIAVSADGNSVWVANRAADEVVVFDANTLARIAVIETAAFPIRVAMTSDGARALVSCAEAGCVQVFDVATKKLAHTIDLLGDKTELSPLPIGICIAPDGDRAWIACQRGEFVAVVDLSTFAMVDRLPIGMGPDGMAYARWIEDGSTALQRTDK
jgi:YVTN family beta-propeller protein